MPSPKSVDVRQLLGPTLLQNQPDAEQEEVRTAYALKDKTVGLLFCQDRGNDTKDLLSSLKKVYAILLSEGYRFEVVYAGDEIAGEKSEGMPWLSLPQEKHASVVKGLEVREFPALVMIAPDGEVLTKDARSRVHKDPKGENYPWTDVPATLCNTPLFPWLMVFLAWSVVWLLPRSLK